MRWAIFALAAYVVLGMELGLRTLLSVQVGAMPIAPSFMLVYLVFIAAHGPSVTVQWAAVILGVLVDLASPLTVPGSETQAYIVGPHALGFWLGAMLTLQLRAMVYRRHPFTMAFLTLLSGLSANFLAVFILLVRRILGDWFGVERQIEWNASDELVARFLVVLYSAVLALPMGWALNRLSALFGFQSHPRLGYPR